MQVHVSYCLVKVFPYCFNLFLNGVNLELVTQYRYLGVTINSDLNWAPHINWIILCLSARKLLCLIYKNFATNIPNPSIILYLYLSLVRPSLEYASQVWDPHLLKDNYQEDWGCLEICTSNVLWLVLLLVVLANCY